MKIPSSRLRFRKQKPSDVERLLLLWTEVETKSREKLAADPKVTPGDKELANAVYDTLHMALTDELVKQAHGRASPLKTTTTETKETKTVTTG